MQKIRSVPHGFISLLLFFPIHEPGMHKLSGCVIVCFPRSFSRPSDVCHSIEHGGVSIHHRLTLELLDQGRCCTMAVCSQLGRRKECLQNFSKKT